MFCHKCGTKLLEGSAFCQKCGAKLSPPLPQAHTQTNVPSSGNRQKKGIIAAIAVLIPVIGIVAFFALRSGDEGETILATVPDAPAYEALVETPENPALPEPLETAYAASQEIQVALLLYLEQINKVISDDTRSMADFSLIYIVDSDIPQLVIDGPDTASGVQVYTVYNGELVELGGSLDGIFYIERQNIFLRTGGRMGYYHDIIYTIDGGSFVILHEGRWTEPMYPDMGTYTWDGEDVAHEEYFDRLNTAFDRSRASNSWDSAISSEEMIEKINALLDAEFIQSDATPATTGRAINLDERLFGSWVEQGDFPYWVILTRTFYSDGTGDWWGDGPGMEFIWWVDGNVLTMDVRCNAFEDEWTEVFRYEIAGDNLTFTHNDGWQRVYLRDSAAPAILPTVDAGTNEVLYNGIPILSLLDSSVWDFSDLMDLFSHSNNSVVHFINDRIITIWEYDALTINGVPLPFYREELIRALGTPTFDGWDEDAFGNPIWILEFGAMRFSFFTPAHRARNIQIRGRI